MLAGAAVFIFCQRLIAGKEKLMPTVPGEKPDLLRRQQMGRRLLLSSALVITVGAIVSSFFLRSYLPETRQAKQKKEGSGLFANIFKRDPESSASMEKIGIIEEFIPDETNFPSFRGQDSSDCRGSGYPIGRTERKVKTLNENRYPRFRKKLTGNMGTNIFDRRKK